MRVRGTRDFLNALLFRRRAWLLVAATGGLAAAVLYSALTSPLYRAEATVKLDLSRTNSRFFGEPVAFPSSVDPVQSQIEVIKSRSVARRVAEKTGLFLDVDAKSARIPGARITGNIRPGNYFLIFDGNTYAMADEKGNLLSRTKTGNWLKGPGFALVVKENPGHGTRVRARVRDPGSVASDILRHCSVIRKGKTDMVRIVCTMPDPEIAARVANALAQEYVEYTLSEAQGEARAAREFIQEQLAQVRDSLKASEDSLRAFKEREGIFQLETSAAKTIEELSGLDAALAQARVEARSAAKKIASLGFQLSDTASPLARYRALSAIPEISDNPQIAGLYERLSQLSAKRSSLLSELSPSHPEVVAVDKEIERVKEDLKGAVSTALEQGPSSGDPVLQEVYAGLIDAHVERESSLAAKRSLEDMIREKEEELKSFPEKEQRLAELQRKVSANRKIYDVLLEKLQEAKIEEARKVSSAKVIDEATVPKKPVSPNWFFNLAMGLMVGLVLGVGAVYAAESTDTRIRSPEEAEEALSVLGSPAFLGFLPLAKNGDEEALVDSSYALAMNLIFHSQGKRGPVLFTSVQPQEGKTFTAVRCALALRDMGKRVLLVDGDTKRPRVHEGFGLENARGFAEVLLGKVSFSEALCRVHDNLHVLTAGRGRGVPPGALASGALRRFVQDLPQEYDMILVDSPPLGIGALDSLEMASALPWTLLVIRHDTTDARELGVAAKQLSVRGARLLGFVINGIEEKRGYYYPSYRYYRYHDDKRPGGIIGRFLSWAGFIRR